MSTPVTDAEARRGVFASRKIFILAAIGSAVGLGNIWRFPYVAYENGGGAFLIPYLVALLTAGLPFLLFDYAIGHRHRGSAPLSFARLHRKAEFLGWWQVGICVCIAVYYAVVLAWALRYTLFSTTEAWGADPNTFFFGEFLELGDPGVDASWVPGVLVPLTVVWVAIIVVLALGVQRGIGATAMVFVPVLVITFGILVVRSLFLKGAGIGLDALFAPNWDALTEPGVWAAAYGQIFFSLSIGFGIMITYASYVGRRTDMTGSGLVVGLSNSGFELLAGIGVFSALGFLAQANGVRVAEVADSGVGLAFVAFPTILNEAPAGAVLGVLFFGSLVLAGFTSLISVLEVVISAVRDKLEVSRVLATLVVTLPAALVSVLFFSTTSGLWVLDILDNFILNFGILLVAVVSMLVVAWGLRALPELQEHMNRFGSVTLGTWWRVIVAAVTPVALGYVLVREFIDHVQTKYGLPGTDYPAWMVGSFGWGAAAAVIVVGVILGLLPWRPGTSLETSGAADEKETTR